MSKEDHTPKPKEKAFQKSWEDIIKFGDCPVCHGDPMACPTPDVPASFCRTRKNALKHMRVRAVPPMRRP